MKYIALLKTQNNEHAISNLSFGQALECLHEQMASTTERIIDALILEDPYDGECGCKLVASLRTVK